MNNKHIIGFTAAITSIVFFAGCTKDVEVNLPDYPPQLAIYSTVEMGNTIEAITGKSISILKYNGNQDLYEYNAKIDIYTDGIFTETMEYFTGGSGQGNPGLGSHVVPEHGKTYTLKASAPGYSLVAEATATMPSAVDITDVKRVVGARQLNGTKDEITITFNDPGPTKDYYTVVFRSAGFDSLYGSNYMDYICVTSTDPSIEKTANTDIIPIAGEDDCIYGEIFFRDDLFNGTTKQIKFYIPTEQMEPAYDFNGNLAYPTVTLSHVSEDYLRFRKTAEYVQNNQGNPFAEPSNVYSNVKNGIGIFTIASGDTREIK